MIKLCIPSIDDRIDVYEYVSELKNIFDADGTNMLYSTVKLDSYEVWLSNVLNNANFKTFFIKDDNNKIVGVTTVRINLTEEEKECGGNIGLNIRPSERRKGYGKESLNLILNYAYSLGLDSVLIDCMDDNVSSIKMLSNNGIYEYNEIYLEENEDTVRRYNVDLLSRYNSKKNI